ncbi:MAG: Gfo/Idh/MocA family oxidoreductase [Pirellulales bacterium]|nr:Gfo/Idh/MocA family oxidoreductase [Pirellulales bacterium]
MPTSTDRRSFLGQAALAAGSALTLAQQHFVQLDSAQAAEPAAAPAPTSPAERLVLASIGCGGQGSGLARSFASQPDVELAYVVDPDAKRAAELAATIGKITGRAPQQVTDLRRVLDDPAVDAVIVATPDHWHGPATLLALAAGKHVYVEKPCAHNVREGRLMIEASRRAGRVVQVGTQSRSAPAIQRAMKLLHEGAIGEVLVAKAWNSQRRKDIGHATPSEPPPELDYALWQGPAPELPYQANRLHYNWHWWYVYGTGDMGNDGVHELDLARWGLGIEMHPTTITAIGGKLFFDDDQQFPDTQYVAFDYPGDGAVGHRRQLVYEMRLWSPYQQEGFDNGNAFYGTKGMLILGKRTGWQILGPNNELREQMSIDGLGPAHHRNFLDCIKSGARPEADIEIGHYSAALCHLGNIAARLGRQLTFDPAAEQIVGDDDAAALVRRQYRADHWAVPDGV